jgi:hypothetical protein
MPHKIQAGRGADAVELTRPGGLSEEEIMWRLISHGIRQKALLLPRRLDHSLSLKS